MNCQSKTVSLIVPQYNNKYMYIFHEMYNWFFDPYLFTWIGIGTTSFGAWSFLLPWAWTPPSVLTRFHFARLFWNQIFTWTSLSFNVLAICDLSSNERYFFVWNSRSSSRSCWLVKAVLLRLDLGPPSESEFWSACSSSRSSLSLREFGLAWPPSPGLQQKQRICFSLLRSTDVVKRNTT